MKITERLTEIETTRDLPKALALINEESEASIDVYLRIIFLLFDFLVDGQYSPDEHDHYALKLKSTYEVAKTKYSENADFIFFSAMMIFVADYYFDGTTAEEAASMLYQIVNKYPDNPLYRWGAMEFPDNRPNVHTKVKFELCQQIANDKPLLESLEHTGLLGIYMIGRIEASYNRTKSLMTDSM
jgi:hypothetical protein